MRQFKNIKFCGDVTPERLAETQKLVDEGVMVSTKHPDEEEAMALFQQQQEHGIGWGLRQLLIREGIIEEQKRI